MDDNDRKISVVRTRHTTAQGMTLAEAYKALCEHLYEFYSEHACSRGPGRCKCRLCAALGPGHPIFDAVQDVENLLGSPERPSRLPGKALRWWGLMWRISMKLGHIDTNECYEAASEICEVLSKAIDTPPPSDTLAGAFTPTEPDMLILEALAKRKTRIKAEALRVGGVGERLKGERLRRLERAGYVDRVEGKKRGWAIANHGRRILAENAQVTRP